jgi:hypothetical protein
MPLQSHGIKSKTNNQKWRILTMVRKKRTIKRSGQPISKRRGKKSSKPSSREMGRRSSKRTKSRKSSRATKGDSLLKRIKKGQQRVTTARSIIKSIDNIQLWRPRDGQHIIDIVPYNAGSNDGLNKEGEETYTYEAWVHRGVGPNEQMHICPAETYNEDCPICEHRQTLRERGADDTVWKALFPKRRNIYNVLCYDANEERKGVQVWEVPYFYAEKNILAIASEPQRGGGSDTINFPHAEHGKSISFTIEPPQSKEDFASYEGFKFLDRDYDLDSEILDEAHALDQLVLLLSYDELKEIYYGGKSAEEKTDEDMGSGSRKRGRGKASRKPREPEPEEEGPSTEDLMDELEECEDLDDLEEFAETYDLDVGITNKSKVRKVKRELEALIMQDQEEEEEEEELEEEEEGEEESEYAYGDIIKMKRRRLKSLIEDEDLDVDIEDAEDLDDLRQMVAEELDIPM